MPVHIKKDKTSVITGNNKVKKDVIHKSSKHLGRGSFDANATKEIKIPS